MSNFDINEVMTECQSLVDEGILTLEEGQELFDESLNDYIVELKKEIDDARNDGIITEYEKSILYINIGTDLNKAFTETINDLISQELNYIEEKHNVPSEEEYYRKQAEKEAKKERRKKLFKKVGAVVGGAALLGAGAYAADKINKNSNMNALVRPDNPEYAEDFTKYNNAREEEINRYNNELKKLKTDVERADAKEMHNNKMAEIEGKFRTIIANKQSSKLNASKQALDNIEANRKKELASATSSAEKRAINAKYNDEKDKADIHKQNADKVKELHRSDYYRNSEKQAILNKRFVFNKKKKLADIDNRYNAYNVNKRK